MKDLIVSPDTTVKGALKALSNAGEKCLVIVDQNKTLLGTLSDGDLRRAILRGVKLTGSIQDIYNIKPTYFIQGEYSQKQARQIFLKNKFDIIPIVDHNKMVLDILFWEKLFRDEKKKKDQSLNVPVVIMAGGKGARLEPFTKVLPKPLVPIDEKPIIEHIIEKFTNYGVKDFYLTVNYKSRILKAYFEELQPEYNINFVDEQEPLGTGGSLKFLEHKFDVPFLVSNCDIITKTDYLALYEFHQKNNYDITLVASIKNYTIPYGTCVLNGEGHLKYINEKPQYDFLVNIGLYVVNPDMLHLIPEGKLYHITHLIEDAKSQGKRVGVYPIDDDAWIDIGQWAEYQKAIKVLNIEN